MHNSEITIIIVTWNSFKYLPHCLESIFRQSFKDFSCLVIDNGSTDGTIEYIKKHYPQVSIQKNTHNLGFCHANNQGLSIANSKYVLLCNADIILEKNFLEQTLKTIKTNPEIASVGGRLLKATWDTEELPKPIKTDIIDSCGIQATKSHYFKEIGADEKDKEQYNKIQEIFGTSGALVFYRKSALEDIKYKNEYLDENFFTYKVDVDIAWRLRLAGYKAIYIPNAIAYHFRGISKKDDRKIRPKLINQLSYKNHLLSILKNQTLINFIIYFPFITWYEFKKIIYLALFEQSTLAGLLQLFKQFPDTLRKRKHIMSIKKVSSKEIRHWFR